MRTLILGAKGQLGQQLREVFQHTGEVLALGHDEVDIRNDDALQPIFDKLSPDLVINAAAYNDVDAAEENLKEAFLVNETGARNIAELAAHRGIPVVYYSTDYVFDGMSEEPYPVNAATNPLNVYGRSKAAGEHAVKVANPCHLIIRTSRLFGPGTDNFVEKVLHAALTEKKVIAVEYPVSAPTQTVDLAEATLALVRKKQYGIYHVTNKNGCTPAEFADNILQIAELDVPIEVVHPADYPTKAKRPKHTVLDCSRYEEVTGLTLRTWKSALLEYMQRRKEPVKPMYPGAGYIYPPGM
jgi:dTDP-4-dehydrorhamnose reductase